jgi:transcriptional regulator with XRE-family HTH domain
MVARAAVPTGVPAMPPAVHMARKVRNEAAKGGDRAEATDPPSSLPVVIGGNLKRLRTRQGYSLEQLAKLAGVSRAMLGQIENGQSVPTILLLLKVADALEVSLAALVAVPATRSTTVLRRSKSKVINASNGRFTLRLLLPVDAGPRVEFYEARLAARHSEPLDAQPGGAKESFVILKGRVELTVGTEPPVALGEGDAAYVEASQVPRTLRNLDDHEAVLHVVVSFAGVK